MSDSKDAETLPNPVQMLRSRLSVPINLHAELFSRPRNNVAISRMLGSLNGMRAVVDPNQHMPESLRPKPFYGRPPPNLELSVTFGAVDADIDVLPFAPDMVHVPRSRSYLSSDNYRESKGPQVHLRSGTGTGNITLRIRAQPGAPVYIDTNSTFGQTRIYLPRTFQGPLTIDSWARTPRLSAALMHASEPVSASGSVTRRFVGDVGAWTARGECGDQAVVETLYGAVWVGYEGEEDEGKRALGSVLVHWGVNVTAVIVLLWALGWGLGLFLAWVSVWFA
ncbi:hypothetical protein DFH09DRAFT_1367564 [Mycena vulgaris]|nr:hypothetical protein DFH09DRAFT_1367564 [Mycena vulgaris]